MINDLVNANFCLFEFAQLLVDFPLDPLNAIVLNFTGGHGLLVLVGDELILF